MRGVTANGSEIVQVRSKRGLTQDELAAQAKLDVKTLRKAEQGKRVDLATLTRLALALDEDVSQFVVEGTSEPEDHLPWRDIILRWNRAWEAEDMEGLLDVYTEDAVLHLPGAPHIPFSGKHCGREEIRRVHETVWSTLKREPTPVDELEILVSGEGATVTGKKGVHLPSGEVIHYLCVQLFKFRGNQIYAHDVQYDTLDLLKRMGFPL